jgi:hypothetical protein
MFGKGSVPEATQWLGLQKAASGLQAYKRVRDNPVSGHSSGLARPTATFFIGGNPMAFSAYADP